MTVVIWLVYFLTSIGAINWGLTKFFDFNLVEYIGNLVKIDYLKEIIYALVSLAGFYSLIKLFIG